MNDGGACRSPTHDNWLASPCPLPVAAARTNRALHRATMASSLRLIVPSDHVEDVPVADGREPVLEQGLGDRAGIFAQGRGRRGARVAVPFRAVPAPRISTAVVGLPNDLLSRCSSLRLRSGAEDRSSVAEPPLDFVEQPGVAHGVPVGVGAVLHVDEQSSERGGKKFRRARRVDP